ncbi:MAG: M48 family metallopeptidase [Deltaproteobacteria bacterium]|nr:M48 family metallopeptidase [Deltaproteobacteria bacterium]
MDFFASQDLARKKTRQLAVLFLLAIASIITTVYLAVNAIFLGVALKAGLEAPETLWDPRLFAGVAATTLAVILTGSLYKVHALREGGEAVARMLGGRPISPNTDDPDERRLLNVVEEMAIAAGMPVPTVFLLEGEAAINAFAAGFSPDDAVIGVSKGCIRHLDRDELQGVVGHEFSHILNGDMAMNLRLMGLLHGILVIALLGYWLLRTMRFSAGSGKRDKEGMGLGTALLLFGGILLAVGWIGVFFGRLIKSSMSRQREFLADASAVQFTRNPAGIAGALKKIGGLTSGSSLKNPNTEQASHLFFGDALGKRFSGLFATHPPLAQRVQRLEPSFDGSFPPVRVSLPSSGSPVSQLAPAPIPTREARAQPRRGIDPHNLPGRIGNLGDEHVEYSRHLLSNLPAEIKEDAREPSSARALIYGLLMDSRDDVRHRQLETLNREADPAVFSETERLLPTLDALPTETRLPLVDLVLPSLRRLSARQHGVFSRNVRALVTADQRVSLFEYTLHRILLRHLAPHFQRITPPVTQYYSLKKLHSECSALLSGLANFGHANPEVAAQAQQRGSVELGFELPYQPEDKADLPAIDKALQTLRLTSPKLKRQLVTAAAATVAFDQVVTVAEGELLRAIADTLDCPMPPFLPGQRKV